MVCPNGDCSLVQVGSNGQWQVFVPGIPPGIDPYPCQGICSVTSGYFVNVDLSSADLPNSLGSSGPGSSSGGEPISTFIAHLASSQRQKEPGCFSVWVDSAAEANDLIPFSVPAPAGGSTEDLATAGASALAAQYIVNRGLVVPLRSSLFRLLTLGETATMIIPAAEAVYVLGAADYQEAKAKFVNHTCR